MDSSEKLLLGFMILISVLGMAFLFSIILIKKRRNRKK